MPVQKDGVLGRQEFVNVRVGGDKRMSDTESIYWVGLWLVTAAVLAMLFVEPAVKAYLRWKRKRTFGKQWRDQAYGLDRQDWV